MKRPITVSIIAWYLIIISILSGLALALTFDMPQIRETMAAGPLSPSIYLTIAFTGMAILIVCGIGLLKNQNWSRFLYIITNLVLLPLNLLTTQKRLLMLPSIIIFALIVYLLFRPEANRYFKKENPEQ